MATNVTEKDKALQEVIDWCADLANNVKADTLTLVIRHCRHMLGYSGSMPSDVPNQSEDAK